MWRALSIALHCPAPPQNKTANKKQGQEPGQQRRVVKTPNHMGGGEGGGVASQVAPKAASSSPSPSFVGVEGGVLGEDSGAGSIGGERPFVASAARSRGEKGATGGLAGAKRRQQRGTRVTWPSRVTAKVLAGARPSTTGGVRCGPSLGRREGSTNTVGGGMCRRVARAMDARMASRVTDRRTSEAGDAGRGGCTASGDDERDCAAGSADRHLISTEGCPALRGDDGLPLVVASNASLSRWREVLRVNFARSLR